MSLPTDVSAQRTRETAARSSRAVLAPFVVSRLFSDTLLVVTGRAPDRRAVLGGFGRWDGRWYSAIATHGYNPVPHALHHQSPWPFFPLFPAAMRGVAALGLSVPVAGVVLNHVAFFVALVGVHRLARRHAQPRTANLAVWLVALGPLSFVFSMLYPSALFLAASVWGFVWVEERRDLAAGFAAAVAALSRPNGVVVAIVLVVAVGFVAGRAVRIVVPVLIAVGVWVAFNALRTGDPFRFVDGKAAWREVDITSFLRRPTPDAILHVAAAAFAIWLVVTASRAMPQSWTWLTFLYLVPSFGLGVIGLGRYATEIFPPYMAGAIVLERPRRTAIPLVFAVLVVAQICCAYLFIADGRLI